MLTIKLFGKPDCGLCDDVKAELAALQATFPHRLNQIYNEPSGKGIMLRACRSL